MKLQRAHAACTDIAEALDRIEAACRASLRSKPRIDKGVTELVRQGIGEHSRQSLERLFGKGRKLVRIGGERHHYRCQPYCAAHEVRHVLKDADPSIGNPAHRSNIPAPQSNRRVCHSSLSSPHAHSVAFAARLRPEARWRS